MSELKAVRQLDLMGQVCPWPVILTLKEVKRLQAGEVLEVLIDHFPSTKSIPEAVRKEGHDVLEPSKVGPGVYQITIKVNK